MVMFRTEDGEIVEFNTAGSGMKRRASRLIERAGRGVRTKFAPKYSESKFQEKQLKKQREARERESFTANVKQEATSAVRFISKNPAKDDLRSNDPLNTFHAVLDPDREFIQPFNSARFSDYGNKKFRRDNDIGDWL